MASSYQLCILTRSLAESVKLLEKKGSAGIDRIFHCNVLLSGSIAFRISALVRSRSTAVLVFKAVSSDKSTLMNDVSLENGTAAVQTPEHTQLWLASY